MQKEGRAKEANMSLVRFITVKGEVVEFDAVSVSSLSQLTNAVRLRYSLNGKPIDIEISLPWEQIERELRANEWQG
jgi:hypothetical protein